jgi:predicted nucleic acid-binding protein
VITGVDTNILCYALDPAYPEHEITANLLTSLSPEKILALNPTVMHETYHTLVFYLEWLPEEASKRLMLLLRHPYIEFLNQTQRTTIIALSISVRHNLGGRDALIIANLIANKIPVMYTHDKELMKLQEIYWKNSNLIFKDPLL